MLFLLGYRSVATIETFIVKIGGLADKHRKIDDQLTMAWRSSECVVRMRKSHEAPSF